MGTDYGKRAVGLLLNSFDKGAVHGRVGLEPRNLLGRKVLVIVELHVAHDVGRRPHIEDLDTRRDDPRRCPYNVHKFLDVSVNGRHNLDARRAVSDDGHGFVLVFKLGGPPGAVNKVALEAVQAFNIRPLPVAGLLDLA